MRCDKIGRKTPLNIGNGGNGVSGNGVRYHFSGARDSVSCFSDNKIVPDTISARGEEKGYLTPFPLTNISPAITSFMDWGERVPDTLSDTLSVIHRG